MILKWNLYHCFDVRQLNIIKLHYVTAGAIYSRSLDALFRREKNIVLQYHLQVLRNHCFLEMFNALN